jgi:hypothetical protein
MYKTERKNTVFLLYNKVSKESFIPKYENRNTISMLYLKNRPFKRGKTEKFCLSDEKQNFSYLSEQC